MRKTVGALIALLSLPLAARADINIINPAYSVNTYFTQGSDNIVSYDWSSSGQLYYMTAVDGYMFGGLYQGGVTSPVVAGSGSLFSGASVIAIGDYIYYNNSSYSNTQYIYKYGPTSGTATATQISTTFNYGLYSHDGSMFITGANGFGTNHIYYSTIAPNGNMVSSNPAVDLGETSGASGPLAFDAAGNLYYAPGYGDLSVYKWSSLEVAAAISDPTGHALSTTGHSWADYSSIYGSYAGATSMLVDGGNLLLTLTNFGDPSELVSFGIGVSGQYDNSTGVILSDSGLLGELRSRDGNVYLSSGNTIYQVVPEPSEIALLAMGLVVVAWRVRRHLQKALPVLWKAVPIALLVFAPRVHAGIYAQSLNDPSNPYDAPIPGFVGPDGDGKAPLDGSNPNNYVNPIFKGWATGVVEYTPAPGVSAGFADPSKTLGPVTGDNFDIASLGDLYDPAHPPTSGGSPVNPNNTSDAYGFIGIDSPGHITLSFNLPITNGAGADFAVFENAFISAYNTSDGSQIGQVFGELGYVEVSTDGVNFARFPSVSNTPSRVGAYGTEDPTNIYNLAGKSVNAYGDSWGTPFNLDDLSSNSLVLSGLVNLSEINYVRIVDIPGSGDFLDSNGHPIYDAWVTFGSGRLDLEAIGVINQIPEPQTFALLAAGVAVLFWRSRSRAPICAS